MASGVAIDILDLRHFAAPPFRLLLDAESEVWNERLHWDYRASIRLMMQYLDTRMLPGYAAVDAGKVVGYAFCVYEETKAVIGDLFSFPECMTANGNTHAIEEMLLRHIFELLQNSPHVHRVESQLLLHPSESHSASFLAAGFQIYHRLFMVQPLSGLWNLPCFELPGELEIRPWRDEDITPAGRLISEAYSNHPDSLINDQYRSVQGSMRFLNNIVRYAGCGVFTPSASHVVMDRVSREPIALILGSRVSPASGHITQICVSPQYRRRGLARMLLSLASFHFMRMGVTEISLTVTESNAEAIQLYRSVGFECKHVFDAAVWSR